ncbi:lipoprotein [Bacillus coahuilensis m2-6]|uniref:Lipoprotein n=1 Tax=Bacillus coahuilensis p1.1.43 TaxID=1150625 RepID=A0A147K6S0_9BACI|nr:hypothetical protein [Bacillus coahuilensis]KUP05748.1 lipoprotein [Bacillus coahuilensis p1.1.43]KUP06785.1 lipoprotein [Bacillus coahuilensis m2-6]
MKKTTKLMTGVMAAMTMTIAACGSDIPPEPEDTDCLDWDWDEETGTYYCDDDDSPYYRSYFYGGRYFKSKSSLKESSSYKSYSNSAKSGIGSGSKGGFGG